MRYDKKFREKTIEYYEKGHTYKETSNIFGISTNTLSLWLKQKRETGSLERKYRFYESKIGEEDLNKYLKENSSAYQSEMAKYFNCDTSTVCRRLKRLKITRKKDKTI